MPNCGFCAAYTVIRSIRMFARVRGDDRSDTLGGMSRRIDAPCSPIHPAQTVVGAGAALADDLSCRSVRDRSGLV